MTDFDGENDAFDPFGDFFDGLGDDVKPVPIDFDKQEIDERELEVLRSLGILELNDVVIFSEFANPLYIRGNIFNSLGDAFRYILDTGAAPFTRFVYFEESDQWGLEIDNNSDEIDR